MKIEQVDWHFHQSEVVGIADEITVFYGDSTLDYQSFEHWLSRDEGEKASRLLNQEQRRIWILSHAFLRLICSKLLCVRPEDVEFTLSEYGKPSIVDADFSFNLSHTDSAFVIAVSRQSIGVDLEHPSVFETLIEVSDFCFSSSELEFIKINDPNLAVGLWTAKEAYLKAIGVGLVDDLKQIEVIDSPKNILKSECLTSKSFFTPAEEVATVVYEGNAQKINFISLIQFS